MSDTANASLAARLPPALEAWVVRHDDSRLFTFLYIGLALVLSIAIGLFWLVAVVAAHFLLEYYKQSRLPGGRADAPVKEETAEETGGWSGSWSAGDKFSIGLGLASIALLLAAPFFTDHSWTGLLAMLAGELKPFP